MNIHFNYQN